MWAYGADCSIYIYIYIYLNIYIYIYVAFCRVTRLQLEHPNIVRFVGFDSKNTGFGDELQCFPFSLSHNNVIA